MIQYIIIGESAAEAQPIERRASNAIEAERDYFQLLRKCSPKGGVKIYGARGAPITLYNLSNLARREREVREVS